MIFETLMESAAKCEVIFVDGGFCHYHLRRDGQLTIREIIVLPACQGRGIGSAMLSRLEGIKGASSLLARCPADLPANGWYVRKGFILKGTEDTKTGRKLNVWMKPVSGQQKPQPKQLNLVPLLEAEEESAYSPFDLDNHWTV